MKYLLTEFRIEEARTSGNSHAENENEKALFYDAVRDLICELAGKAGYESFEETAFGVNGYIQQNTFNENALNNLFQEEWIISNVTISYNTKQIDDKDWNETWENIGFEPIFIEDKCMIYDARKPEPTACNMPIRVAIETKNAFGTGTHETTRMVVSELFRQSPKNKNVLDCGCGTGILGIVALKAGAQKVTGYDIDEWSVENAKHNAALNNTPNINVLHGDSHVIKQLDGLFDVIVANINRNILLQDMPLFAPRMSADGILIISGFYINDIPLLVEKARACNLKEISRVTDNNWACLTFART